MKPEALFHTFSQDLEESVRVDRELAEDDEQGKLDLLQRYHITASAATYLRDLFARMLGEAKGDRKGANHWLYGYYGSGKSHLLAVTGLLLNSEWVEACGRDVVWTALNGDGRADLDELHTLWSRCLDTYWLHPLLINLLKEQEQRQRGFGRVILRRLHEEQGLSSRLKTAFFEQWYLQRHSREALEEKAAHVLQEAGVNLPADNVWRRVQKYPALAEGVLPKLFEKETGVREGLADVTDRNLKAEVVARQLEKARLEIEDKRDRPVRLLLLLDEITLFIGTQYGLLTELNAITEAIDEVGEERILTVGTAQEDLSQVRTDYAAKKVDFSILDDRFPHQYSLPSSHVGDIVQNRLLRKTDAGRKAFEQALSTATLEPANSLVYRGVEQNTDPRLDRMDADQVSAFLPLLPYQPPLFLEILARLRTQKADRAKSIFSGTARAVLAIVNGLVQQWAAAPDAEQQGKGADLKRTVSLVDFFEFIRPELKNIIGQEVKTIEEVETQVENGDLQPIDAMVCKVVLLLQYVPEMIPLDETKNVAVALMDDLDGDTLMNRANAVEESLSRLGKFIRTDDEHTSYLRFTTQEEQVVLNEAEEREAAFDAPDVVRELSAQVSVFEAASTSLWAEVLKQLDLPSHIPYKTGEDTYPVGYTFDIDGCVLDASFGEGDGLQVSVHVEGLVSGEERTVAEHAKAFLWKLPDEGRAALYNDLKRWAALSAACREHYAPPTIAQQLRRQSQQLPARIAARIRSGDLKVRSHNLRRVAEGVKKHVHATYPKAFHPEMLRVDRARLQALRGVAQTADLPGWAEKIEVVYDAQAELRGNIVTTVRGIVGRRLKKIETLSISEALKKLRKEEESYQDVEPALVAILWGLCQRGTFQPVSEDGEPLSADRLLDPDRWHEIRIRIGHAESFREQLGPFVGPNDTANDAVVQFRSFLVNQRQRVDTLGQQVRTVAQHAATKPVEELLGTLVAWLSETHAKLTSWLDETQNQQPQWGEIVEKALEAEKQIGKAQGQWDNREAYLLQLDALLLLGKEYTDSVGADVARVLNQLSNEAEAAVDARWWTDDGWTEYVDTLSSYNPAITALRSWWEEVTSEKSRKELLEQTRDHPWLIALDDPSFDHTGGQFRRKYLDGLRAFRKTMERQEQLLQPLMRDAHALSTSEVRRALGRLREGIGPGVPPAEKAEELLQTLRTVDAVTGGAGPSEISGIGTWPKDRKELTDPLKRLAQSGEDVALEENEHGIMITLSA